MAITTSRVGVVIDALVASLKLSATFADPVRVFDGPVITTDVMFNQAVFVGFEGDWQGSFEACQIDQEEPYLGNSTVRETLELRCCADSWGGDPTWQTLRNSCLALLAGVETVIRTDRTLGIDGTTTVTQVAPGTLIQAPTTTFGPEPYASSGSLVRIPFIVHVTTYLMTV